MGTVDNGVKGILYVMPVHEVSLENIKKKSEAGSLSQEDQRNSHSKLKHYSCLKSREARLRKDDTSATSVCARRNFRRFVRDVNNETSLK